MVGRHRRISVPTQRGRRPLLVTDAHTGGEHVMDEAASPSTGRYVAMCGDSGPVASLVTPALWRCVRCAHASTAEADVGQDRDLRGVR